MKTWLARTASWVVAMAASLGFVWTVVAEVPLPEGYTATEYVQATGQHYIDTGVIPTSETRTTMDIMVASTSENWFGVAGTSGNWWADRAHALSNDGGGIYIGHGANSGTYGGSGAVLPVGWRGMVELSKNVFRATPLGASAPSQTLTRPKLSFTARASLWLFANNSQLPYKDTKGLKCYGCKIWLNADDAQPVRDFVPCWSADGIPGLWDKVEGKFYSVLTGAFLAPWPADGVPASYSPVDYIQATGSQYLDTGVTATANTTIDITFGYIQNVSDSTIFGTPRWAGSAFLFIVQSGYFKIYGSSETTQISQPLGGSETYRLTWGANDAYTFYKNGAVVASGTNGRTITDGTKRLSIFSNDGASHFSKMRLYGLKIGEGETLIRDLVPCRNKLNVAGLFDKLTGRFYGSSKDPFLAPYADRRLPAGYVQVEYIQASGQQYIDTGVVPTSETRTAMDVRVASSLENWFGVCGLTGGSWWNDNAYALSNDGSGIYIGHDGKSGTVGGNGAVLPAGWRGTVELDKNVYRATPFGTSAPSKTLSQTKATFTARSSLWLFANNSGNPYKDTKGLRCYGCKIWQNSGDAAPVRDFVPCINLDGDVGMWDKVEGKFYGNLGPGVFTSPIKRTGVTLPEGYKKLDWVESSGTQTLDTGYHPKVSTQVTAIFNVWKRTGGWTAIFGEMTNDSSQNAVTLRYYNSTAALNGLFCNATYGEAQTPATFEDADVVASLRRDVMAVNGTRYGLITSATPYDGSLILFGERNASEIRRQQAVRLYAFVISEGGVVVHDYVPCRNESGVCGLYDLVDETFKTVTGEDGLLGSDVATYAKLNGDGYAFYNKAGEQVEAPENGITGLPLAFANDAEYQALVAAPERVAQSTGVMLERSIDLAMDTDWSAIGFDMDNKWIVVKGNRLTVGEVRGAGTIGNDGQLLQNPGFDTTVIAAGASVTTTPVGWSSGGTVRLIKNNASSGARQQTGSNWCEIRGGGNISQKIFVVKRGTYKLSLSMATLNDQSYYYQGTFSLRLDGTEVASVKPGYNTENRTYDLNLMPGEHSVQIAAVGGNGILVENLNLRLSGTDSVPKGTLAFNVPEGVMLTNSNVTVCGGPNMQVWKTGAGTLVMAKVNTAFGVTQGADNQAALIVKAGVVEKTTNGATCGTQYSRIKVENGARFDVNGRRYWDYSYTIEGAGPDGAGALFNSTSETNPWRQGTDGYLRDISLTGDATIGGSQVWGTIFYNYGANTLSLNGHTLTYTGAAIYGGNLSYAGEGRVVIDSGCLVEFVTTSPTANNADLEVNGTLQQNNAALTPIKSLVFAADASYNALAENPPAFTVRKVYAPNRNTVDGSKAASPVVVLGTADDLETTLDLSRLSETFDASSLSFLPGSSVTVDLGAREVVLGERLVAWSEIPNVLEFVIAGNAAASFSLKTKADGLYIAGTPTYATIDPATGTWSFFAANGNPYSDWDEGVTTDIDVRFSSKAEYDAIVAAGVTPKRYVLTGLQLTEDANFVGGFAFVVAPNAVVDLKGHRLDLPYATLEGSTLLTITDTAETGYDYLTYIEAPGQQYIDTGFTPNQDTRTVMEVMIASTSENWFGVGGASGNNWWNDKAYALSNDSTSGGIYIGHDGKSGSLGGASAALPVGWRGTVELNGNVFTATELGATTTYRTFSQTKASFTARASMWLFANNAALPYKDTKGLRCFGCKIYASGTDTTPVRDFVPVRRLSDGAVGLLDTIAGTFYGNKGSGAFTAGSVVTSGVTGELHVNVPAGVTATTGANTITGGLKLVKDGEGTLIPAGTLTFIGGTRIDGGILQLAEDAVTIGTLRSDITVNPGAILEVNGKGGLYNNGIVLAGGTLQNTTGTDVGSGTAQFKFLRVTADSTMNLVNSCGLVGNGYSATMLDLGNHELTVNVAADKNFWFYNVTVGPGTLTVTGAGSFKIDKTSLRASAADFNLDCAAVDAVVNCEVNGWTVGADTSVTGAGTVTINGAYKPIGDSITKYVLKTGATLDLSGRNTAFDITGKSVSFANNAKIFVKPQPQKSGLIVPWTTPSNLTGLTFEKVRGEAGRLSWNEAGISFERGLTIILR